MPVALQDWVVPVVYEATPLVLLRPQDNAVPAIRLTLGEGLLVVVDPEQRGPDVAAAVAACTAAAQEGVPVVACTGPGSRGAWVIELGAEAAIARVIQKSAAAAHTSQSRGLPELTRRIDLLDGREYLWWLQLPRTSGQTWSKDGWP